MLLIEIGLTVWAWKRGWRGWALLPLAVGLSAAFGTGFVVGAMGGSPESVGPFAFAFDAAVMIALIAMAVKGREVEPATPTTAS